MPAATHLEQGALTAWSRAQQAALFHRHLAEQHVKDEAKAEKDEKEKKEQKKKDEEVKPDKVTAASIVATILQGWCPALYEFLDIFGAPHVCLPVFIAGHVMFWFLAPWYFLHLLPLLPTHLIPLILSLKSLFSPASTLEKAYDDSKRAWQKTCEDLKKQGKEKADFPDTPAPPPGWQVNVRDRKSWLAYWVFVGGVEYLELVCFGGQVGGLIWWPKIKAAFLISLYFVWETDEKGNQTTGSMKLIDPFLPTPKPEEKSKDSKREQKDKEKKK